MKNPLLKLVLIILLLFGALTTYAVSRYLTSPSKAASDRFIQSHPGKPVLLVAMEKEVYSSTDPINYHFILLNGGDQAISLPVLRCLDYDRLSEVNVIPHTLIVTDQDGVKVPSMFNGEVIRIGSRCTGDAVKVFPHEVIPCVDCQNDARFWLVKGSSGSSFFDKAEYARLLRQPGVYYLQVGYESGENQEINLPVWKGLILSNRVRFEIKP